MAFSFEVDAQGAFAKLDAVGPTVRQALLDELTPIEVDMTNDARARALAHFHSIGAKPGLYLASIYGGVSNKGSSIVGYVRSSSPLAHLLELGFTIKDMIIEAKSDGVMAFEVGGIGEVFSRKVHRPETVVEPYPAIFPAFEAKRAEIAEALERIKEKAGGS
jgi:hypothetical protein